MSGTVLVVGASGLVGTAAALSFLDADWKVVAASRREPALLAGRDYQHIVLDLKDAVACRKEAANLADVTHVVYAAVFELPGLVRGWSDPEQIATNGRMLENLMEPLAEVADREHGNTAQNGKDRDDDQ